MIKSLITILFLFLVLAACNKEDPSVYGDCIKQFYATIQLLERQNSLILNEYNDMLSENESRIAPYYQMVKEAISNENEIYLFLDSIQPIVDSSILKKLELYGEISDSLSNDELNLKQEDVSMLKKKMDVYKKKQISLIRDTSRSSGLIRAIQKRLSTTYFDSIRTFKHQPVSQLELLACFYKLRVDISLVKNDLLAHLNRLPGVEDFRFENLEAFIVPNSQILPPGFPYRCEIFLAAYDTTAYIPEYEIEGKKYGQKTLPIIYDHRVTEKLGKVTMPGNFLLKDPRTGKTLKIPFKIEYEVLKKNKQK